MVLTDTLPGGVTFDSATPSQGSLHGVERHGHLHARARSPTRQTRRVEIKVTPQGPGTLTNQASVTSDLADPDTADTQRERARRPSTRWPTCR